MSVSPSPSPPILAVDPGREKCGIAVVTTEGVIVQRQIAARADTVATVAAWWQTYQPGALLIGDSTGTRELAAELRAALPNVTLTAVNERNSTLEARTLYWQHFPPRGWQRLIPLSLQVPPVPLDDFAAVVLAQRYLKLRQEAALAPPDAVGAG